MKLLAPLLAVGGAAFAGEAAPAPISFEREVVPLLVNYCYDCHGDGKAKSGLALDSYYSAEDVRAARDKWELVLRQVSRREMPPDDGGPMPSDRERELISRFVEQEVFRLDPAHPDPGRVVLRRLNRAEYSATIRDLVGVDFAAGEDFPPDDSGYGFDNVADVLSVSPVLLEKYLAAAERIVDAAIPTEPIRSRTRMIPSSLAEIGFNALGDRGDGWAHLISLEEDDAAVELALPAGDYRFRVLAYATRTGGALKGQGSDEPIVFTGDPGPTRLTLMLDDTVVEEFTVTTDADAPAIYETRLGVPAGRSRFRAVVARERGGESNETVLLNGRPGRQQPGIVYVRWLQIEGPLPAATRRVSGPDLEITGESRLGDSGDVVLLGPGEVRTTFELAQPGEVILRAQAYAQQAGTESARMEFRVDGRAVQVFDVRAPARLEPLPKQRVFSTALLAERPRMYLHRLQLPAGRHNFSAGFVNDFRDPAAANPNLRDRNLIIRSLEVAHLGAPPLMPEKPEPIRRLFAAARARPGGDDEAARRVVSEFAYRAWRRPVAPREVDRLMTLYGSARAAGEAFEPAVKLALQGVLVSPHFLFIGDRRASLAAAATGEAEPLDDFALATRLSYFLWSSTPDDELLALAAEGRVRAELPAQVRRMLASPKSRALVENFAGQWLQIRSLANFAPDRKLFPEYDPVLRTAMQRETEVFFSHVMREDRSILEFLTADYTFVNARLARFYGLPGITGDEFQRVSLADTPRRGVLTHAGILTLTSNPTRTSPVKRGKWVLENLLGTPPPPPPPEVPELDDKSRQLTGTLRQQMEQHSRDATCASCHARMDPIGFGLENFNAIGAWRDRDGDAPVDAGGELGTAGRFANAIELSALLADKRRHEFVRNFAEKMLIYALGRGTEYYDRPAIDGIVADAARGNERFSAVVLAVASSLPFQFQRAAPAVASTDGLSATPVVSHAPGDAHAVRNHEDP